MTDSANAVAHFEKALNDANVYVKRAAIEELAKLMDAGKSLPPRTAQRVNNEREKPWLDITDEKNAAAYKAHTAITLLRYNEALVQFRNFQDDIDGKKQWPQRVPVLFLQYPALLNDLGRAFQYTVFTQEGLQVFLQWEKNLLADMASSIMPDDLRPVFNNLSDARFRLLFFAARMARRAGSAQAVAQPSAAALFEQALSLAPDNEQKDACIWYLLDLALTEKTDNFARRLEQFIPLWHSGNYYNDVLEKYLQKICAAAEWQKIVTVFNLISGTDAAIKAAYAYVIARAVEEGRLSTAHVELTPTAYKRFAYDALENNVTSLLYYRAKSAESLALPFLPERYLQQNTPAAAESRRGRAQAAQAAQPSALAQFLIGFFANEAADHAPRFVSKYENELTIEELRRVAEAYESAGMYVQSIRLVSRYVNRAGYASLLRPQDGRRDLELLFPAAYKDLAEKYAKETDNSPYVLLGLMRTESAFQPSVVSRSGAVGLTQLLPDTALDMANRLRRAGGANYTQEGAVNLNDPDTNVHIGAFYLAYLMGRFEDELIALLAYNGGMNRIRRLRVASTLPADLFMETISIAETRDYGRKVLSAAAVYKALYY